MWFTSPLACIKHVIEVKLKGRLKYKLELGGNNSVVTFRLKKILPLGKTQLMEHDTLLRKAVSRSSRNPVG